MFALPVVVVGFFVFFFAVVTSISNRLVGLVVKASASRAEDPVFESRLHRDFSGVKSYQ